MISKKKQETSVEKNQLVISDEMSLKEWKDLEVILIPCASAVRHLTGPSQGLARKWLFILTAEPDELEDYGLERITLQMSSWVAEATSSARRIFRIFLTTEKSQSCISPIKKHFHLKQL